MMNDCNSHNHYTIHICNIYVLNIVLCEIVRLFHWQIYKQMHTARLRVHFHYPLHFDGAGQVWNCYYNFFFTQRRLYLPELYTYYAGAYSFALQADMFCQKLVLSSAPFSLTAHTLQKSVRFAVLCWTFDMFMREICKSYSLIMMFIMRKSCG